MNFDAEKGCEFADCVIPIRSSLRDRTAVNISRLSIVSCLQGDLTIRSDYLTLLNNCSFLCCRLLFGLCFSLLIIEYLLTFVSVLLFNY